MFSQKFADWKYEILLTEQSRENEKYLTCNEMENCGMNFERTLQTSGTHLHTHIIVHNRLVTWCVQDQGRNSYEVHWIQIVTLQSIRLFFVETEETDLFVEPKTESK